MKPNKALYLFLFFLSFTFLKAQNSACLANDTLTIIVIGSSTAAGSGASTPDSAWVNRYRRSMQALNPANQVINLAQGGYNTWRLMPDYFTPPSGRPNPDTLRNISHALRQNPDAIIINLPSNDAAIGTGLNEQMTNFIHIDSLAASQNVPLWVCTTQPRNFSTSQIQIQLDVRDSILSYFGPRAIDFWTGLANSQNTILAQYNSGDGTHVNDAGHRLLWQEVLAEALPDSLVSSVPGFDLQVSPPLWTNPSPCGSPNSIIEIQLANLRSDSLQSTAIVELIRLDLNSGIRDTLRQNLNQISGCSYAQVQFNLNSNQQQHWQLHSRIVCSQDSNSFNNVSSSIDVQSEAGPQITGNDPFYCEGDSMWIRPSHSGDQLTWFSDAGLSQLLNQGDSLYWSPTLGDSLFLQSYQGPFYYIESLSSARSSNIKWNGCMFNLIAGSDTVSLDSIQFVAGTSGDMQVNLRTRLGSYQGHENTAATWSASISDSIYGALEDSSYVLNFGSLILNPGDTLGCYLYLENSNQRLAYQSAGSMQLYQGAGLSVQAGSGIQHTFGTIYHPRAIRAQFYYHYGFKADGQCQSTVDTIIPKPSPAILDLGLDFNHSPGVDLILYLPPGFSNPVWNDGSTADSLFIPSFSYENTLKQFILSAIDSLGCMHSDTLAVQFLPWFGLEEAKGLGFTLYPNPNQGQFHISNPGKAAFSWKLMNTNGKLLSEGQGLETDIRLKTSLAKGLYYLRIEQEGQEQIIKLLIQ